ncbi:hypothetical protein SD51_13100 [Alicyclobacillus tengchongensis]|nr:hypothetical protein SD51_13100 [Alicyclobacillus tengchongensis]
MILRKRFETWFVSSVLPLGLLVVGVSTASAANNVQVAKPITTPATPHSIPPQLQGKPAQLTPDPGIVSAYSAKTTDIGFESDLKSSKNLDPGMTPQYPPSLGLPNAHPAKPGKPPKTKN